MTINGSSSSSDVTMESLRVQLLDGVRAWNTSGVELIFRTRHELALFAVLILSEGARVSRHRLAGSLWPDASPEARNRNLRQRIHDLRDKLGDELSTSRDWLSLNVSTQLIDLPSAHVESAHLPIDPSRFLAGLDFDFVAELHRSLALPEGRKVGTVIRDFFSGPTGDLDQSEIEDWFEYQVIRSEITEHPYSDRYIALQKRCQEEADFCRSAPIWFCATAFVALNRFDHRFIIDCASRLAPVWEAKSDELAIYSAFVYECAANSCHARLQYHECLAYLREASRAYRTAKSALNVFRMKFKYQRVHVDLGALTIGAPGLGNLQAKYGDSLPIHLRAMLDYNLVFAHSANGDVQSGLAALDRAKRIYALDRFPGWDSLLAANAASLYVLDKKPQMAAAWLLKAIPKELEAPPFHGSSLGWLRAVEIFAATGQAENCAFAAALTQRVSAETNLPIGALNLIRLNQFVASQIGQVSGNQWLAISQEAKSLSLTESHFRIIEGIERIAK